jgi:quinol-cytochrome oxidoreductase complex cytochrome b subunit
LSQKSPDDSSPPSSWKDCLKDFFFERLGLDVAADLAAHKRVPVHGRTFFYFLGGMALFLFGIQVVTGILLALYYKPSPDQAFESVQAIMTEIDFGWLFRSIHSWSANLLIGVLLLHVLTTFMMRAYRGPREVTWITGVLLFGVFLAFGFSGYLLPWNQLAFFATRVGTAIAGVVPVVGEYLLLLARGGDDVTGDTLARFYALHVVILPLTALGLLGVHLFLVQKHGISAPERVISKYGDEKSVPAMPFVPHFLVRDMVGWYIALGLLAVLAALFPWGLGQKADPFGSAPPVKPEWYFLFMFQTLKHLSAHLDLQTFREMLANYSHDHYRNLKEVVLWVSMFFFGICGLFVLILPFIDFQASRWRSRILALVFAALAVMYFLVMFVLGLEGEMVGVLFFGFCGAVVLIVPFLDFAPSRARARRFVNFLAAMAVIFFVVMTTWGLIE